MICTYMDLKLLVESADDIIHTRLRLRRHSSPEHAFALDVMDYVRDYALATRARTSKERRRDSMPA